MKTRTQAILRNTRSALRPRFRFLTISALSILDRIVEGEERWQTLGMTADILLIVAHTWRDEDEGEVIRVISARKATPRERRAYAKDRQHPSQ